MARLVCGEYRSAARSSERSRTLIRRRNSRQHLACSEPVSCSTHQQAADARLWRDVARLEFIMMSGAPVRCGVIAEAATRWRPPQAPDAVAKLQPTQGRKRLRQQSPITGEIFPS